MYAFALKRRVALLQVQRQPITTSLGTNQTISLGSYRQNEVPPHMRHDSDPVPYEEYIQRWDTMVRGMEQGGDAVVGMVGVRMGAKGDFVPNGSESEESSTIQ